MRRTYLKDREGFLLVKSVYFTCQKNNQWLSTAHSKTSLRRKEKGVGGLFFLKVEKWPINTAGMMELGDCHQSGGGYRQKSSWKQSFWEVWRAVLQHYICMQNTQQRQSLKILTIYWRTLQTTICLVVKVNSPGGGRDWHHRPGAVTPGKQHEPPKAQHEDPMRWMDLKSESG